MKTWLRAILLVAAPYLAVLGVMLPTARPFEWPGKVEATVPLCKGARALAASSKGLAAPVVRSEKLPIGRWKRYTSEPFVLESNAGDDESPKLLAVLQAALRAHTSLLGPVTGVFKARCFAKRFEFGLYAKQFSLPEADSFYAVDADEIVLCHTSAVTFFANAVHEFCHQFVYRKFTSRSPWLLEGLAEYMCAFECVDGKLVPGHVDPEHLAMARRAVESGATRSLGSAGFYHSEGLVDRYAVAWLAVHGLAGRGTEKLLAALLRNQEPPTEAEVQADLKGLESKRVR